MCNTLTNRGEKLEEKESLAFVNTTTGAELDRVHPHLFDNQSSFNSWRQLLHRFAKIETFNFVEANLQLSKAYFQPCRTLNLNGRFDCPHFYLLLLLMKNCINSQPQERRRRKSTQKSGVAAHGRNSWGFEGWNSTAAKGFPWHRRWPFWGCCGFRHGSNVAFLVGRKWTQT